MTTEASQYDDVKPEIDANDWLFSRLPLEVSTKLGYYVYLYFDPRDNRLFYVGKGQGGRVLAHLYEVGESRKIATLHELKALGLRPRIDILAHALPDEETALRIEAAVIDLFGLGDLTNAVRGWRSVQLGRIALGELMIYYAAEPVDVDIPVIMFRINKLYRHNITDLELYEATRGVWKLGTRREKAKYTFAIFEGVVRAVYEIQAWQPAGTTPYETRIPENSAGRWEFVGKKAYPVIQEQYVGKSIAKYFKKGLQSPCVTAKAIWLKPMPYSMCYTKNQMDWEFSVGNRPWQQPGLFAVS